MGITHLILGITLALACTEVAVAKPKKDTKVAAKAKTSKDKDGDANSNVAASKSAKSERLPANVGANSSYANRSRLGASILAEMGFIDFPQFGYGARAAFLLSPRLTSELGYIQSDFEFFGLKYTTKYAATRMKYFVGNSFYVTGGAGYRVLEAQSKTFEFKDFEFKDEPAVTLTRTSVMGDLAIGNQWQWSGFTLGCDWIGALMPLATLSETVDDRRKKNAGASNDATRADDDSTTNHDDDDVNSFRNSADATKLQAVRFYLGWSF